MAQLVNVIAPIMTETRAKPGSRRSIIPTIILSVYGRGKALQPIIHSDKYDSKEFTEVPYLDSAVVLNEKKGIGAVYDKQASGGKINRLPMTFVL
ncbi:hypothetical protein [Sinobaca sp. H24]|uniref:hypothetical protein n=1 Tax=Sinobaca sp. H24 TaxID=2923376 RepID=UPI00207A484F